MPGRVVVGMSGGVDSAVAAYLLQQQGFDVTGVFMNNWEEKDPSGVCSAVQDFEDVRACCVRLGIPYYSVNFAKEYRDRVFETFLEEYRRGYTPNPDVLCNREIKFGELLNFTYKLGADRLATGHYGRIEYRDGLYHLLKAKDLGKDQSYFLYMLGQPALSKAVFPIGEMQKSEVRQIAADLGLPVAAKKDSTGVCFIGERDFKAFLSGFLPAQPGEMRTPEGKLMGKHDGLMYYTIGQRGGLGIGGAGEPWFVVDKNVKDNVLIIAQGKDNPLLYSTYCLAEQLHFIAGSAPASSFDCYVKIRYRQADQLAHADISGDTCRISFDRPQRAVTPGQSVVLYQGDECLGGGVIRERDQCHG